MKYTIAAALLLGACSPNYTEECPEAVVEPISLPEGCWESEDCEPTDDASAFCGRAYVCNVEYPGGDRAPTCVVAAPCACLEALEACGADVDVPQHCDL